MHNSWQNKLEMTSYDLAAILESPGNKKLLSRFQPVKVAKGETLRSRSETEPDAFVVTSGELRAYLSFGEQEFTVFTMGRGEVIPTHTRLIIEARKPSELLVASRRTYQHILMASPELHWASLYWTERRLDATLKTIVNLKFLDVRNRLIRFILDLSHQHGRTMLDGISIPFDYTVEEVANIVGTSRQSASQVLNELIKLGYLVRLSRAQLIIPDRDSLAAAMSQIDPSEATIVDAPLGSLRDFLNAETSPAREDEPRCPICAGGDAIGT